MKRMLAPYTGLRSSLVIGFVLALTSARAQAPIAAASPAPIPYATVQMLSPDDSAAVIAEKAAKVLPRPNQTAWMRLERTFFLHFGVNTFNAVEWGTGREEPSIFNPSALDANQWLERDEEFRRQPDRARLQAPRRILHVAHPLHAAFGCLESVARRQGRCGAEPWPTPPAPRASNSGVYLSPADLYQLKTNRKNPTGYYGNGSSKVLSVIPTDPASFKTDPRKGRTPPTGFELLLRGG